MLWDKFDKSKLMTQNINCILVKYCKNISFLCFRRPSVVCHKILLLYLCRILSVHLSVLLLKQESGTFVRANYKMFLQNDLDGDFKLDDMDLDTSAPLHESETGVKTEPENSTEEGTEPEVKIKDEENQPELSTENDEVQAMETDSKEDVIKKEETVDDNTSKNAVSLSDSKDFIVINLHYYEVDFASVFSYTFGCFYSKMLVIILLVQRK